MSVVNFTKYDIVYDHLCSCGANVRIEKTDILGTFVKFEDAEASSNSLQQLKAEIAAIADGLDSYMYTGIGNVQQFTAKLRQLSAV
jgi:TRAP-type uncharacterized transport system substrate-binding protein